MSSNTLEQRIEKIEQRNQTVEAAKAWETSWARKILVAVLTYLVISGFLIFVVGLPNPWINALVPTIGFLLSTLSVELAKSIWIRYLYKK